MGYDLGYLSGRRKRTSSIAAWLRCLLHGKCSMKTLRRLRTLIVVTLFVVNQVQYAMLLGSDPYVPLAPNKYRVTVTATAPVSGVPTAAVSGGVSIWHDSYSPMSSSWLALGNSLGLLAIVLLTMFERNEVQDISKRTWT